MRRPRSLVEAVELYGKQAEDGTISKAEAAKRLQQFSDGGLTRAGAADMIRNYKTARASLDGTLASIKAGLRRFSR